MSKHEKLIEALKNASENKPVKVRCINADDSSMELTKNEIYYAYGLAGDCLYLPQYISKRYITRFELVEEKEKKMTRENFIKLLEYNGFKFDGVYHYNSNLLSYKNGRYIFDVIGDETKLFENNEMRFISYLDKAILLAKVIGIELKPLPNFRPHWKIKVDGKETGDVIYADEVKIDVECNYYKLASHLKAYKIMTSFNSKMYKDYECDFAYYKDNILYEAVWVGEEKCV